MDRHSMPLFLTEERLGGVGYVIPAEADVRCSKHSRAARLRLCHPPDRLLQLNDIHRLGQVLGESCLQARPHVAFHSIAAECNPANAVLPLRLAHQVAPISIRQAQIADQQIETIRLHRFQRCGESCRERHAMIARGGPRAERPNNPPMQTSASSVEPWTEPEGLLLVVRKPARRRLDH